MARQKTRSDRGGEEVPHPDPTERYERWERDFFAAQKELAAIREEIAVATERQRELSERQREISGRCVALLEKLPGCLLQPSPPLSTSGGALLSYVEAARILGFSSGYLRKARMNGFLGSSSKGGVTPPPCIRLGRMVRYRREDLERWIAERAEEANK